MKKKHLLLAFCLLLTATASRAQIALPYSENFIDDMPDGWTTFRKGDTTGSDWEFNVSADHEGNYLHAPSTLVNDWVVSPAIDLSVAAKMAFRFSTFTSGTISPGDSLQCYLLSGNLDPSLATVTLLCNVHPDGTFTPHDTLVHIPATPGNAYIAFRYTSLTDSIFSATVTNIHVTIDSTADTTTTGVLQVTNKQLLSVYPNPSTAYIKWNAGNKTINPQATGYISDIAGHILTTFPALNNEADIRNLAIGVYVLHIDAFIAFFAKE